MKLFEVSSFRELPLSLAITITVPSPADGSSSSRGASQLSIIQSSGSQRKTRPPLMTKAKHSSTQDLLSKATNKMAAGMKKEKGSR